MSEKYTFIVACHESGLRLDIFLSRKDLALSRSQIKRAVDEGMVLVNGLKVKAGYKLRNGDIVHLLAYSCKRRHFCPSCHQKRVV